MRMFSNKSVQMRSSNSRASSNHPTLYTADKTFKQSEAIPQTVGEHLHDEVMDFHAEKLKTACFRQEEWLR